MKNKKKLINIIAILAILLLGVLIISDYYPLEEVNNQKNLSQSQEVFLTNLRGKIVKKNTNFFVIEILRDKDSLKEKKEYKVKINDNTEFYKLSKKEDVENLNLGTGPGDGESPFKEEKTDYSFAKVLDVVLVVFSEDVEFMAEKIIIEP